MVHCILKYTVSQKKQDTKLLAITSPTIIRFSKFFTSGLGSKFATKSYLNIPPGFKRVATLPCEIWMQKNGIILKYIIFAINDESQGSIAKNLRCDEFLDIYHSLCWWKNF